MVDGRSVQRYLKAAEEGYRQFDIPRRLTRLADDISIQQGYLTANQQLLFNTVHRQAYEIRRKAERNCRRLSMGRVHWSPKMQQKWDRLHLYHLLLLGHRQVRTSSRKVRRLMKSTGLSDSWKMTELELQEHWAAEQREYKEAKRNLAFQWRTEYSFFWSISLACFTLLGTSIPYLCVVSQYFDFTFERIAFLFFNTVGTHHANAGSS